MVHHLDRWWQTCCVQLSVCTGDRAKLYWTCPALIPANEKTKYINIYIYIYIYIRLNIVVVTIQYARVAQWRVLVVPIIITVGVADNLRDAFRRPVSIAGVVTRCVMASGSSSVYLVWRNCWWLCVASRYFCSSAISLLTVVTPHACTMLMTRLGYHGSCSAPIQPYTDACPCWCAWSSSSDSL
jgi:hypothetical protein